jgi:membrane protease subunit (stomatin/prohibitin family)
MGFLKKNLLSVIEWTDDTTNTLVYRYAVPDRYAIMKGSKLVVRESQAAIFVAGGQIADIFTAGTYTLDAKNLPIITKILSWKYAFETPYKDDIYFVNLRQFTNIKWGTTNPIMLRDSDFGLIRLRGFGNFSFRVTLPKVFMRELFGTIKLFKTEDIENYLKNIVLTTLTDLIGECKIPALDLASQYLELGDTARDLAKPKFAELGLECTNVFIQNLSLPPEVEKALDERTTLGVLGDKMGQYAQYQAANAMRDAAKQPGGLAGSGMGIGAGMAMGGMMAKSFAGATADVEGEKCPKCGSVVGKGLRFCAECGTEVGGGDKIGCPKCGASVKKSAKFCPECGSPMSYNCTKCGVVLKGKLKFCPECGAKIVI